jgi:hypothetical protein
VATDRHAAGPARRPIAPRGPRRRRAMSPIGPLAPTRAMPPSAVFASGEHRARFPRTPDRLGPRAPASTDATANAGRTNLPHRPRTTSRTPRGAPRGPPPRRAGRIHDAGRRRSGPLPAAARQQQAERPPRRTGRIDDEERQRSGPLTRPTAAGRAVFALGDARFPRTPTVRAAASTRRDDASQSRSRVVDARGVLRGCSGGGRLRPRTAAAADQPRRDRYDPRRRAPAKVPNTLSQYGALIPNPRVSSWKWWRMCSSRRRLPSALVGT